MKPHQIKDARDRAFALRAEARQPISYERLNQAFNLYRQFHNRAVTNLEDLAHDEIAAVLAIAAHEPR